MIFSCKDFFCFFFFSWFFFVICFFFLYQKYLFNVKSSFNSDVFRFFFLVYAWHSFILIIRESIKRLRANKHSLVPSLKTEMKEKRMESLKRLLTDINERVLVAIY